MGSCHKEGMNICTDYLPIGNLIQAGVTWKEGTLIEMAPPNWPVDNSLRVIFLFND